jgi:hypothetical protein
MTLPMAVSRLYFRPAEYFAALRSVAVRPYRSPTGRVRQNPAPSLCFGPWPFARMKALYEETCLLRARARAMKALSYARERGRRLSLCRKTNSLRASWLHVMENQLDSLHFTATTVSFRNYKLKPTGLVSGK